MKTILSSFQLSIWSMASSCSDSDPINLIKKINNRQNFNFKSVLTSAATKRTETKSVTSDKSSNWSKDGGSYILEVKAKNSTSKRQQKLLESQKKVLMIITTSWGLESNSIMIFRNIWMTKLANWGGLSNKESLKKHKKIEITNIQSTLK